MPLNAFTDSGMAFKKLWIKEYGCIYKTIFKALIFTQDSGEFQ